MDTISESKSGQGGVYVVHEEGLPLIAGETVNAFNQALELSLSAFWAARGIHDSRETGWFFRRELFSDNIIVSVEPAGRPRRLVRQNFTRGSDGAIQLNDPVNVRRVVSYVPLATATEQASHEQTAAQRRSLPAAAYAAPWFDNGEGAYLAGGTFLASKSKLEHRVNVARGATEQADVACLRNALASFNEVDWTGFPGSTPTQARARLERHADAILMTRQCKEFDPGLDMLRECLADLRAGRDTSRWFSTTA